VIDEERTPEELERDRHRARLDVERVVFFSDAVFAIAITLLAIDLRLPPGTYDDRSIVDTLVGMAPEIFAFALSFAVIAMFWLGHYRTFRRVERVTPRLIGVNMLFLAFVALLPFPTSVIAREGNLSASAVFYAAFVCVTSLLSASLWVVAQRAGLLSAEVTPDIAHNVTIRALAVPLVFAASIPVAIVAGPALAEPMWVAAILIQSFLARRLHLRI